MFVVVPVVVEEGNDDDHDGGGHNDDSNFGGDDYEIALNICQEKRAKHVGKRLVNVCECNRHETRYG